MHNWQFLAKQGCTTADMLSTHNGHVDTIEALGEASPLVIDGHTNNITSFLPLQCGQLCFVVRLSGFMVFIKSVELSITRIRLGRDA